MDDLALAETTGEELRAALGRLVRRLRRESGMPIQQVWALARLDRQGPMTTSALAASEHITPQSMAATLSVLFDQGLVERAGDPDDRRQVLWSLTPRGRAARGQDRSRRSRWLTDALAELTAEDIAVLRRAAQLIDDIMDRSEAR